MPALAKLISAITIKKCDFTVNFRHVHPDEKILYESLKSMGYINRVHVFFRNWPILQNAHNSKS